MQDLHNKIKITALHTSTLQAASLVGSSVIDTANFDSLEIVAIKDANTVTTGTFIIDVESGSANATTAHTSATTSEIIGTNVVTMVATTANVTKIGYIGADRYVSVAITPGSATGVLSVFAIQSNARKQPTS